MNSFERFWSLVDIRGPEECWPWTGESFFPNGYGQFNIRLVEAADFELADRKQVGAHRAAFYISYGFWAEPFTLHACDFRPCCNPAHLHPGDHALNGQEMSERGRAPMPWRGVTGSNHPKSKLTPAQRAEIRERYEPGVSQVSLAAEYNVTQRTISNVVRSS